MEFEHTQAFCLMSPVLRGSLDMTTDIAQYRAHIQLWKRVAVSLGLHHPYWVYSALEAFLSVRVQLPYGFRVPEFWTAFLEYWDALCARHGAQDPRSDWTRFLRARNGRPRGALFRISGGGATGEIPSANARATGGNVTVLARESGGDQV